MRALSLVWATALTIALAACGAAPGVPTNEEGVLGVQARSDAIPVRSVSPAADAAAVPVDRPIVVRLETSGPDWNRNREQIAQDTYALVLTSGADTTVFLPAQLRGPQPRALPAGVKLSDQLAFDQAAGTLTARPDAFALGQRYTATLVTKSAFERLANTGRLDAGPHLKQWSFTTANAATSASAGIAPGQNTASVGPVTAAVQGSGNLTVATFDASPAPVAPSAPTTGFFDVLVDPGSTFSEVTVTRCDPRNGAHVFWWNGGAWSPVNPAPMRDASGCLTFKLTDSSSPTIAQLTGEAFASSAIPDVTAISPTSGPDTGCTVVDVTGVGFTGASAVLFGGVASSGFNVASDTQLSAYSTSGSDTVDVQVQLPDGSTSGMTSADRFTFEPSAAPTDTAVPTEAAGPTSVSATATPQGGAVATAPAKPAPSAPPAQPQCGGTAVLAQANVAPQTVLELLR